ncbi:MAG: primosomal protein N' family DNA-binding protein, partial [Thiobacillus sp.]
MTAIVQVALDAPLDRLFDYSAGEAAADLAPGSMVEVPFGRTRQVGVVLGRVGETAVEGAKLRTIIRVLDDRPALTPDILRLARFCADYYHYPLGAILLATLPPRLKNAAPYVADAPWLVVTARGRVEAPAPRARARLALLEA